MNPYIVKVRSYLEKEIPNFGYKLKEARELQNRPVQVLATEAGISTGYWYQLEQETREWISEEVLRGIELVLNIDFDISFNHQVKLKSDTGINYKKLRNLLTVKRWKEADEETENKILELLNTDYWFDVSSESLKQLPFTDIETIDRLWLNYSNGRYGFSVQKRIYESFGSLKEFKREEWDKFGKVVGWKEDNKWLRRSNLSFTLDSPEGHLPFWAGKPGGLYTGGGWFSLLEKF